ncbi:hypothetical protein ERJ75_001193300 [Trypanosoma vivax]|nr:hypothetical protein ERJ75_001193300 [Trypanosoma vivax]
MPIRVLREAIYSATAWAAGDFFAQFFAAHWEVVRRRAERENGAENNRHNATRPPRGHMMAAVDRPRLVLAALFGVALVPLNAGFNGICSRVIGVPYANMFAAFVLLSARQLFMTPLTLLLYHNTTTYVRGGFDDPTCIQLHKTGADARMAGSYGALAVERRIMTDVMPYPLLSSWLIYFPLSAYCYLTPKPLPGAVAAALLIPWTAHVSYIQKHMLL